QTLTFAVIGTDPDLNTTLHFTADGLPQGAALHEQTGTFTWKPGPGQAGDYAVRFRVDDGELSVTRSVLIRAALEPAAPVVTIELTPSAPAVPGQRVLAPAVATSLADIVGLTLKVNGEPVALDGQGRATIVAGAAGRLVLQATATDADGLVGQ